MQSPGWYFHRLRSMDAGEILWRIRSLLSAQFDLVRMPLRLYPQLRPVHRVLPNDLNGGFGFSTPSHETDWNSGDDPFVDWLARLCQQADQVMQDRLSFFDLEQQFLGDPIDWQKDWSAGKSGPLRQSSLTDYRDFERVGDCKLVWEPNRHHQLVVLARAYRVTRQRRYAKKVVSLMLDWIKANPVGYGMNWRSPLELGIRIINWVWAIDMIRGAGVLDDGSWAPIVDSIYVAQWDMQRKFSAGSSANNHLIGEAAGVFIATSFLPSLPGAPEWREKSKRVLETEILRQTFEDGCTKEHAFGYQFFVIQFLSLCSLVAKWRGEPFSGTYMARLQQMYRFVADISADTGKPPNMGDADSGYVLNLGELPDQADELISVGGHLFDDSSLIRSDRSETAYWLFGSSSLARRRTENVGGSQAFPESGYFALRSASSKSHEGRRLSIFFDCAELGYGNIAAHGHADCLSFTLNVGRREFLVDPGTYDYFSHPEWRRYFRMTRAHNTVTVDDMCQSVSLGPFLWGSRAKPLLLEWRDTEAEGQVSGQHDGYARLPDPVIHKREICMDKIAGSLVVTDSFDCQASHEICRYFHVSAGCSVEQTSDISVTLAANGVRLNLSTDSGVVEVVRADEDGFLGWVSPGYHRRRPSHCIRINSKIKGTWSVRTNLTVVL